MSIGAALREEYRTNAPSRPAVGGNSAFNEAFTFSEGEYNFLKKIRPDLFDQSLDPHTRRSLWVDFSNSSVGRHFRVR